jgi:NADH-quinone oxidoreductase subunit N
VRIDHVALLPAYCAAGTAVLAFLVDLVAPRRRLPVLTATMLGAAATGVAAWWAYRGTVRATFCVADACSYRWNPLAVLVAIAVTGATFGVLALSVALLRAHEVPAGEYCFLLACSMTGGVVLGAAGDLITLVVALETLTLPLYVLVGLRRRTVASAEAAVTFFVVSVISTAVTLLGAALLYGATGTVHLTGLRTALAEHSDLRSLPIVGAAVVLVLVGLAFKVAAVPFHAWAPATYDGAPLPVAAYLSTASKLGGVVSLLLVAVGALTPMLDVAGPALAVFAVLTMTVGNLVALRQRRMVRLLAWSSVAQAGYILAPLGAFALAPGRAEDVVVAAVTAVLAYTVFYLIMELGAFGAVVALRGSADGGEISDYRGAARRRPWVTTAFVLALAGLAGLPPGLAGLFAKVAVVRSLLDGAAGWLAVVVALNAVVGLAYYVRVAAVLFQPAGAGSVSARGGVPAGQVRLPVAVGTIVAAITLLALVVGFAPQLVLDAASAAAR